MRTFRTADFHRIKTDHDRLYYAAGIPFRFWNEKPGEPTFTNATWAKSTIKPKQQAEWFEKLTEGKAFRKPHLVLFASDPTDETALAHMFQLCKRIVREPTKDNTIRRIQIEVASDDMRTDAHNATCEAFMLHNVLAKSDRSRVTTIRDWAKRNESAFRLIALAGTPDDFRFSYGLEPNAIFMFDDTTIQRTQKSFG